MIEAGENIVGIPKTIDNDLPGTDQTIGFSTCVDIVSEEFPVLDEINKYVESNGEIFACGTCLVSRKREGTPICPMSSMKDLMEIVEKSDRLLTF